MRLPRPAALKSRKQQLGELLALLPGLWLGAAFVCLFFTKRYPALDSFVTWTFRAYVGAFSAFIAGVAIMGPGVLAARELVQLIVEPGCSRFEARLTWIWAGFAGFLLTALLGFATWMVFGPVADVKLWFIGVCWTLLMIPWAIIGYLIRRFLRG
jgi:hypothetical protein